MQKFSKWKNYKKLNLALVIIFLITTISIIFVVNLNAASTTSGNFTADYIIQNSWGSGAVVNVTITNKGSTVEDWTTKWTFTGNEKITNMWSAEYKQSGNSVTITNSAWNGTIQKNGSQSFGFSINYSGDISTPSTIIVTSSTSSTIEPTVEPTAVKTSATVITKSPTPTKETPTSVTPDSTDVVPPPAKSGKTRVIVTTDGEIDDQCSMVRFLLYSNDFDVEAIVKTSSQYHSQSNNWAGDYWEKPIYEAYGKLYPNLIKHDSDYPTLKYLQSITKLGNVSKSGEMTKETEGSQLIADILMDETDSRPIWLQAWEVQTLLPEL